MHNFLKCLAQNVALCLSMNFFAVACSPKEPSGDVTKPGQTQKIFDPELLALLPKNVPGSELGWLSGRWVRSEEGCGGSTYMQASASREGLHVITAPEPAKAENGTPVAGRATVNPGEREFTNVTPPDWDDAYLRMKAKSDGELEVEFVAFIPEDTRWNVTETFTLKTCE